MTWAWPLIGLFDLDLGLASDWSSLVGGTQKPGLDGFPLSACTWSLIFYIGIVDLLTTETPNPKSRLYWYLIEFIDWRYSTVSQIGIFDQLFQLLPL